MNERIKELHNRACRLDMEQYPNAIPDGERIQQKFAELIIRECVNIAYQNDVAKFTRDGYVIGQEIEKHFGVEK
jgi:hypothetical protein